MNRLRYAFFAFLLALLCCKKPYNPPASSSPKSYLVVEGFINSGNDTTVIKLSRTLKLTDKVTENPVLGASVTVEGEQGGSYALYDVSNSGHYNSLSGLNLSGTQRYRLRIQINGSQYLSDYVELKPAPPIDSIGYTVQNNGINLYVNAHDANNSTRYYLWDFDETWIFHSEYASYYFYDTVSHQMVSRSTQQSIYSCFGNDKSSSILLSSTEKLAQDVVYQSPLTQIALTSEKLESKYSILLRQYALTKEAFEFYQNLQKNTEQLGGIFDAQPSEISGNIHNIADANEPVIGYVAVTTVQSKRIFIAHAQLPGNVQPIYPFDCQQSTALFANEQGGNEVQNILESPPYNVYVPTGGAYPPPPSAPVLIGYMYSSRECVDCTLRGTTQTPAFWQ